MKSNLIMKAAIGTCFLIFTGLTINAQELKDVDGNVYKTIQHGVQTWIASNLSVANFRNGDAIPEAKTPEEWASAAQSGKPAWCWYDNDPEKGKTNGRLYNWFAVNDPRGLAPEGWHVAKNEDWRLLIKNLTGIDVAGAKMKSMYVWKSKRGSNDIGFDAIPSGHRTSDGKFKDFGTIGRWWSNSVPVDVKPSDKIFAVELSDYNIEVKYLQSEKGAGLSVRCAKDLPAVKK